MKNLQAADLASGRAEFVREWPPGLPRFGNEERRRKTSRVAAVHDRNPPLTFEDRPLATNSSKFPRHKRMM
jgi:hypothetical protein